MFDIFDPQTITFVMISDVIILKRSFAIRVISEWLILYSILKRSHVISDVIIILKRSYMISDIIILLLIYCSLFISSDDHRSDLGYYEYSMYIYIYIGSSNDHTWSRILSYLFNPQTIMTWSRTYGFRRSCIIDALT